MRRAPRPDAAGSRPRRPAASTAIAAPRCRGGRRVRRAVRPSGGRRWAGRSRRSLGYVLSETGYQDMLQRLGRRGRPGAAGEHRGIAHRRPRVRRAHPGDGPLEHFWKKPAWSTTPTIGTPRRSRHPDDAARLEGAGISGGLSSWPWKKDCCRTNAAANSPNNSKRSGG